MAQTRFEQLKSTLEAAKQLAGEGRFLDAIGRLESCTDVDHSLLRPLLQEAAQLVKEYPRQREAAIKNAAAAIEDARALQERRQHEAAYRRLASTPSAFMTAEMRQLAGELKEVVGEAKQLHRDVAEALKQKQYDGLLHRVERLIELTGDDAKYGKLCEQLRAKQLKKDKSKGEKLALAARAALKKSDYAGAGAAISQIPEDALEGPIGRIAVEVRERVWLHEQIKSAPFVDATLLKAAERLHKLQPQDEQVEKLLQQINRRWAQQLRSNANELAPWAQPPKTTSLETPIALCPLPALLDKAKLKEPGAARQMLAAFGLAVQAAGKAKYPLNLSTEGARGSWLGRIPKLRSSKGGTACWGVDVGVSALKAVQLTVDGDRVEIAETVLLRCTRDSDDQPGGEHRRYSDVVARFLSEHDVAGCAVAINLSGAQTLGRFFELPAPKPDKFADAVKFEVKARIPIEADQVVHDHAWTPLPNDEQGGPPRRRVVLAAANREHVDLRLQPWTDAGATRLIVQSGCVALANAFCNDLENSEKSPLEDCSLLVEVGADTTDFVTLTPHGLWFRGAYLGMQQFDAALAVAMRITQTEAEQLRRNPERASLMHEADEQMQPQYAKFTEGIRRIIDQFQHESGIQPSRVLLCGGGSHQFGMLRRLRLGR